MIHLDVVQGTPEWINARLGIPTASEFHRIITPKTMKLSAGSQTYLCELIAERFMGAALDSVVTDWIARGTALEADAIAYYELCRETETAPAGFALRDDRRVGCSPDRFVGEDGGLEIKCPAPATHVGYLLESPHKYAPQIQGALWITGREWWDFLSFHPEMPPVLTRTYRDEEFIGKLAVAVDDFLERLDAAVETLKERGFDESL